MKDQDLRQAMLVLESYREQLDIMRQQITLVQSSLEESVRARETINKFKDAKEGDEIFVPIGASVFVPAKVTGKKQAIVGVGNRISVEKELQDTEDYMNSLVVELQESLKKINKAYYEIQTAAENLTETVNAEYSARQQQQV
ncbi:MAG TPA: prefoldin subunit alpha [Candidatus Methanomethylophilaceae archaeon]|jgi:prefoldin alpha subunit|nr:prefoldin subunit alpha [Candidatus Methanomethylophilaceae archaeon]